MKPWNCQGKFCRTIHMRIRQPLIPTNAAVPRQVPVKSQSAQYLIGNKTCRGIEGSAPDAYRNPLSRCWLHRFQVLWQFSSQLSCAAGIKIFSCRIQSLHK